MDNVKDKISEYFETHKDKCYALNNWKNLQMKSFTMREMLEYFYEISGGSFNEMDNIITHLTTKRKLHGRTQVYGNEPINKVNLVRNESGQLELRGYNPNAELPLKGQHLSHSHKTFSQNGQVNKHYQNKEEKLYDVGEGIRLKYPNFSKDEIENAIKCVMEYAAHRKINPMKVIKGLEKDRYQINTSTWRITPKSKNESIAKSNVVVINESDLSALRDELEMTEHKFHTNIRHFISQLLQDPVNAQPSLILKMNGYNRTSLLKYLLTQDIIQKQERISDKDENGEPKTATMIVKYLCPKKNFDRKLQKLYIKLFEKNLPPRVNSHNIEINEEGEGGAVGGEGATSASSSGQFIQPLGNVQRRKITTGISETATADVGDYQYTVPFCGDKETLARKNGVGGSVSVNHT